MNKATFVMLFGAVLALSSCGQERDEPRPALSLPPATRTPAAAAQTDNRTGATPTPGSTRKTIEVRNDASLPEGFPFGVPQGARLSNLSMPSGGTVGEISITLFADQQPEELARFFEAELAKAGLASERVNQTDDATATMIGLSGSGDSAMATIAIKRLKSAAESSVQVTYTPF